MPPIDPSSSKCYTLLMPNPDSSDPRLRLDARTGSSRLLEKSRIIVHGGLTTPLRLTPYYTIHEIKSKMKDYVMELPLSERKTDPLEYVSNEVFTLSLVNRNWIHIPIAENSERPAPRFFHAMVVYDSFIYISGGLTFIDKHFNIEVLNDTWQFDMISKVWKCITPPANDQCIPRFDHKMIITPDLIILGKNNHHGLLYIGGVLANDKYVKIIDVLDLIDFKWVGIPLDSTRITRFENGVQVPDGFDSNIRVSVSDLSVYHYKDHFSLMVYYKPESKYLEPLLDFDNERLEGVRLSSNRQFIKKERDLKNYPYELYYPTLGFFGENIIVTGFIPGELTISAYLLNKSTGKWVRLQIYCSHNVWSHRFCKGFVWPSHHKVIFLGNNDTSQTPPSCQFFNIYISVSLPFTNTMGADMTYNKAPGQLTDSSGGTAPLNSSIVAQNSSRIGSITSTNTQLGSSTGVPHTSFAAYSHYVAPQIQINSVRSVFPPYAVALGKNAFERSSSLSDLELVSYEGDSIRLPISLLRARWGRSFEEMLCTAYAMAAIDSEANPDSQSSEGPTRLNSNTSSYSKTNDNSSSNNKSTKDETPPMFRYPFQDKSSSSSQNFSTSSNKDSPVNSNSRVGSPGLVPRHPSIDALKFDSSISLSRRSSFNAPTKSRQNSLVTTSSRRSSTYSQPASRRGSLISKQSSSTQSQQSSTQQLLQQQQQQPQLYNQQQLSSSPISSFSNYQMSKLGSATGSSGLPNASVTPSWDAPPSSMSHSVSTFTKFESEIYVTELPAQPPMPDVNPSDIGKISNVPTAELVHHTPTAPSISLDDDLKPPTSPSTPSMLTARLQQQPQSQQFGRASVSSTASSFLSPSSANKHGSGSSSANTYIASRMQQLGLSPSGSPRSSFSVSPGGPGGIQPLSELRSVPMEDQSDDSSENNINDTFYDGYNDGLGSTFGSPERQTSINKHHLKSTTQTYSNVQFDVCKIPRVFGMPYATETVKAVAEFLYTGQVGSNWKIFPTATEVMLIAKFYEIPLLYDLILEVLYAVVAKKETQLIEQGRLLKEECIKNEIHFNPKSRFHDGVSGIAAIDQFDSYLSKMDDGLLDLTLLKRASKIASRTSRTLESKTKSKKEKNKSKSEDGGINNNEDKDEYPLIPKMTINPDSGNLNNSSDSSDSLKSQGSSSAESSAESALLKDTIALIDPAQYDLSLGGSSPSNTSDEQENNKKTEKFADTSKEGKESTSEKKDASNAENEKTVDWPTFKDLTDPNAPACPDILIDMLAEVAALNSDLKLLLRAMNAREMAGQLKKEKKHLNSVLASRADEFHSSKLNSNPSKTSKTPSASTLAVPGSPPPVVSDRPVTLDPASGYNKVLLSAQSPFKPGYTGSGEATESTNSNANIPQPFKSSYATDIVPPTPTTSENPITPTTPIQPGMGSSSDTAVAVAALEAGSVSEDNLQGSQHLQPPGYLQKHSSVQSPDIRPSITPSDTPPKSHSMTHLTFTKLENPPTSHVYYNHPPSIPTPPTPNQKKQQVSLPPNPSQLQQQYPSSVQHFSSLSSSQQQLQQQMLRSSSSNMSTLSNGSSASASITSGVSAGNSNINNNNTKKKSGVGKLFSRLKSNNH